MDTKTGSTIFFISFACFMCWTLMDRQDFAELCFKFMDLFKKKKMQQIFKSLHYDQIKAAQ